LSLYRENSFSPNYHPSSAPQQNLGGHRFEDGHILGTAVITGLMTQDIGLHQQEAEKSE